MSKLSKGKVGIFVLVVASLVALIALAGCTGEIGASGPTGATGSTGATGPPGVDATVACQACHDAAGTVNAKLIQWTASGHGIGESWEYAGARNNCTSCHSGTGFVAWTAAGGSTSDTVADVNNTPIDCRACHQIHTTYTGADFALTTTAPVALITDATKVYDAGDSNLCAGCHQARRAAGGAAVTSTHYGPHHGPQANMFLGVSGYGDPQEVSPHYTDNGCVTCHMAADTGHDEGGHAFTASLEGCQSCHEGLDTMDRHDVQTEIKALLADLNELLEGTGAFHDGHPVVGDFTEDIVGAVYNYMFVLEDYSYGVHNSYYAKYLLEKSIADLS